MIHREKKLMSNPTLETTRYQVRPLQKTGSDIKVILVPDQAKKNRIRKKIPGSTTFLSRQRYIKNKEFHTHILYNQGNLKRIANNKKLIAS